jgi:CRISPR/Cas system Type II protein with McrA/HNH and RuvC-like nuclease domain
VEQKGEPGHECNLERGGEGKIPGNRTAEKVFAVLGDAWRNMPQQGCDRLVQEVLQAEHPDELAVRLEKAYAFDSGIAAQLSAIELEQGYCALSRRAMRKLLPGLETGRRLNEVRKEIYGAQLLRGNKECDRLPAVGKVASSLRNPVVSRALSELRKVVNAIVREYGKPAKVRIELARDIKKNQTPREAYPDPKRWAEIVARVRRFRGGVAKAKLRRFQLEAIPEDFAEQQLNDTRYMSRLEADYVALLFGGRIDPERTQRIQVGRGRITKYLRDEWNLNSILFDGGTKERTDHRHHAVDAVAIALTDPATVGCASASKHTWSDSAAISRMPLGTNRTTPTSRRPTAVSSPSIRCAFGRTKPRSTSGQPRNSATYPRV